MCGVFYVGKGKEKFREMKVMGRRKKKESDGKVGRSVGR